MNARPVDAPASPPDVSVLLVRAGEGDARALDSLIGLIQSELKAMAVHKMRGERVDHTWTATALVNEAVLKLIGPGQLHALSNRRMLYAAAARAMRQTLIDHARARSAARRGGGWRRTPIDDAIDQLKQQKIAVDDLHEALDALAVDQPRTAQIIELRFFGGAAVAEIAELLGVSASTIEKELLKGRELLRARLG